MGMSPPPPKSMSNSLQLQDVPTELAELNKLEIRLISLRIPFMQMVAQPRGNNALSMNLQ